MNNILIGYIFIVVIILIIFIATGLSYTKTVTVPSLYSKKPITNAIIPNIIHRTWHSKNINQHMYQYAYQSWMTLNPDYNMIWHSVEQCGSFLKQYPEIYKAWDKLIPLAYKADLWRACRLYHYGGVYVDASSRPFVSINDMIPLTMYNQKDIFISALDPEITGGGVHNGFIIATPKHPYIKAYIDLMLKNIEAGHEDEMFALTGPVCLKRAILSVIGDHQMKLGYNDCQYPFHLYQLKFGLYQSIYDGKKIILKKKYDIMDCFLYKKVYHFKNSYTYNYMNDMVIKK